jgi:hypothetical protein
MNEWFLGVDLGQVEDYTAIVAIEKVEESHEPSQYGDNTPPSYHVRLIERIRRTPYHIIAGHVKDMLNQPPLCENSKLVVDATGVGRPVIDEMRRIGLTPVAILITSGEIARWESGFLFTPKRDLVTSLQLVLQGGRLRVAEGLTLAQELVKELLTFQVKITPQAHETFGVWRSGAHDDLVLATAMGIYYSERKRRSNPTSYDIPVTAPRVRENPYLRYMPPPPGSFRWPPWGDRA